MEFKAIILEGADCCGKTSFAKEIFKKEKNAILLHFPRIEQEHDVKVAIADLNKTLYNQYYMDKFYDMGKYFFGEYNNDPFGKLNSELFNNLRDNIESNGNDKISLLEFLNELKDYSAKLEKLKESKKEFDGNCTIEDYTDWCVRRFKKLLVNSVDFKINGKSIKKPNTNKKSSSQKSIDELFTKFISSNKDKSITIIFDRFFMSGDVYNYIVPMTKYVSAIDECCTRYREFKRVMLKKELEEGPECTKEYKEDKYKEIENDIKNAMKDINQKKTILEEKQISITSKIIRMCNELFADTGVVKETGLYDEEYEFHIDGIPTLNPIIRHYIFKTNDKLVEISKKDKSRKFDEYDKNLFIQTVSREAFASLYSPDVSVSIPIFDKTNVNSIVVDSDKYLEYKTSDNGRTAVSQNNELFDYNLKKIDIAYDDSIKLFEQYIDIMTNTLKNCCKLLKRSKDISDFDIGEE